MNGDTPRYLPISVQDVSDYHPVQGTIRAKRVNYRLQDGTVSYVIIPESEYTKEAVHIAIERAANHHENVMSIRGGQSPLPNDTEPGPWG